MPEEVSRLCNVAEITKHHYQVLKNTIGRLTYFYLDEGFLCAVRWGIMKEGSGHDYGYHKPVFKAEEEQLQQQQQLYLSMKLKNEHA